MSDERPEERIEAPKFDTYTRLHDDRVGMSAVELLARGEQAFEELLSELEVLHRQLPRKSEPRLRRTRENRTIVEECLRGARAKVRIAALGAEGLGSAGA